MKVIEFDQKKGIFSFELEELDAQFHAHPAVEILFSKEGNLEIKTQEAVYSKVSFAVIGANVPHQVFAKEGLIKLLMVEGHARFVSEVMQQFEIEMEDGIFVKTNLEDEPAILNFLSQKYAHHHISKSENLRIQQCLDYLNSTTADYNKMIAVLKEELQLSESRLSHIFKAAIGISLKKYLVWSRLKSAFQLVVDKDINLYQAALESGFYDQAHLSKAFKQFLGLNPSEVFNSRTLQD